MSAPGFYSVLRTGVRALPELRQRAMGNCRHPKRFRAIGTVATAKLAMLDAAKTLDFMRSPPGNRLEALKGDRAGQWSVRINDQWRVCFIWTDAGPDEVEIVDLSLKACGDGAASCEPNACRASWRSVARGISGAVESECERPRLGAGSTCHAHSRDRQGASRRHCRHGRALGAILRGRCRIVAGTASRP
jgi:toxin HigB-1